MDSWLAFLDSQGAQCDGGNITHFLNEFAGAKADPGITALCALTQLDCLWVEGTDARKFLQGQVTCNMNDLRGSSTPTHPGRFTVGAHCNTKGRMVFSFHAVNIHKEPPAESFALIMERDLVEPARQTLAKYAVFSKSRLSLNESHVVVGLCGPQAAAMLEKVSGPVFTGTGTTMQNGSDIVLTLAADRFLCLLSSATAVSWWQQLQADCYPAGYPQWQLARIRAGEGGVCKDTVEQFIPQQLNFDILGGVSFSKGCYIGQEVVARMRYRGKLKRHMRRAAASVGSAPAAGGPLFGIDGEQSIGTVVDAVALDSGTIELLAVVTDDAIDSDGAYLDRERSQKLQFLPLPYAITN